MSERISRRHVLAGSLATGGALMAPSNGWAMYTKRPIVKGLVVRHLGFAAVVAHELTRSEYVWHDIPGMPMQTKLAKGTYVELEMGEHPTRPHLQPVRLMRTNDPNSTDAVALRNRWTAEAHARSSWRSAVTTINILNRPVIYTRSYGRIEIKKHDVLRGLEIRAVGTQLRVRLGMNWDGLSIFEARLFGPDAFHKNSARTVKRRPII